MPCRSVEQWREGGKRPLAGEGATVWEQQVCDEGSDPVSEALPGLGGRCWVGSECAGQDRDGTGVSNERPR